MPAWLLPVVIILLYGAALGRQSFALFGRLSDNRALVLSLGGAALVLHAFELNRILWAGPGAIDLGLLQVIDLTAWLLCLVITLAAVRLSVIVLIPVVYLIAIGSLLLGILFSSLFAGSHLTMPDTGLSLHIIFALSSYILLLCATLYSVMLRSVDRHLKRHQLASLPSALPPLMTMERHLFQLLVAGWSLLTITLLSGMLELYDLMAQHVAHKLFFTLVAWLLYSVVLFGHWRLGWRGRRSQIWLYTAFGILTLGYFGSRFVLSVLLGYR